MGIPLRALLDAAQGKPLLDLHMRPVDQRGAPESQPAQQSTTNQSSSQPTQQSKTTQDQPKHDEPKPSLTFGAPLTPFPKLDPDALEVTIDHPLTSLGWHGFDFLDKVSAQAQVHVLASPSVPGHPVDVQALIELVHRDLECGLVAQPAELAIFAAVVGQGVKPSRPFGTQGVGQAGLDFDQQLWKFESGLEVHIDLQLVVQQDLSTGKWTTQLTAEPQIKFDL